MNVLLLRDVVAVLLQLQRQPDAFPTAFAVIGDHHPVADPLLVFEYIPHREHVVLVEARRELDSLREVADDVGARRRPGRDDDVVRIQRQHLSRTRCPPEP